MTFLKLPMPLSCKHICRAVIAVLYAELVGLLFFWLSYRLLEAYTLFSGIPTPGGCQTLFSYVALAGSEPEILYVALAGSEPEIFRFRSFYLPIAAPVTT